MTTEYERKRLENIKKNNEFLKQLGLETVGPTPIVEKENKHTLPAPKRLKTAAKPSAFKVEIPRRTSLRVKGVDPDGKEAKSIKEAAALREKEERAARARVKGPIVAGGEDEDETNTFLQSICDLNSKRIKLSQNDSIVKGAGNAFTSYTNQIAFNGSVKVVKDMIYTVEFHPSPTKLLAVVGDKHGTLAIWDVNDTLEKSRSSPDEEVDPIVYSFKPFKRAVSKIMYTSHDLNKIFMSSHDGSIRVF